MIHSKISTVTSKELWPHRMFSLWRHRVGVIVVNIQFGEHREIDWRSHPKEITKSEKPKLFWRSKSSNIPQKETQEIFFLERSINKKKRERRTQSRKPINGSIIVFENKISWVSTTPRKQQQKKNRNQKKNTILFCFFSNPRSFVLFSSRFRWSNRSKTSRIKRRESQINTDSREPHHKLFDSFKLFDALHIHFNGW